MFLKNFFKGEAAVLGTEYKSWKSQEHYPGLVHSFSNTKK